MHMVLREWDALAEAVRAGVAELCEALLPLGARHPTRSRANDESASFDVVLGAIVLDVRGTSSGVLLEPEAVLL